MSITLTESAATRVNSHLATRDQGEALRVSVKTSGCSGYAYQLDYATQIDDDDKVYESHGVKVVVREAHLKYLSGMEINYVEDGLSSAFQFRNPNVTEQCGCGESFTVN